jgi:predicted GH43/DUF377 family glycosyl hydrolase
MRIVQSLWTFPRQPVGEDMYRWALSCVLLRKHYGSVHLITDDFGKSLLIDKLRLPYDSVSTTLQNIHGVRPGLWAFGKIVAFEESANSGEPFLHIDDDIFLLKKLPEFVEQSGVVTQCFEPVCYYRKALSLLTRKQRVLAALPDASWEAYNTGVFGGTNLGFIKEYCKRTRELVNVMMQDENCKEHCNTIFEQAHLAKVARELGVKIDVILDGGFNQRQAERIGFCHLMQQKYSRKHVSKIPELLKQEDPGVLERVERLFADDTPSIRIQCAGQGFRCRAFSARQFPRPENRNFNPSMHWTGDRFRIIYRSQPANFRDGFSEIWAADAVPDDNPKASNHRQVMAKAGVHVEDPRLLQLDGGRYLLSYVEAEHDFEKYTWKCRQRALVCNKDLVPEEEFSLPETGKEHEKNWTFFTSNGIKYVYSISPHVVVDTRTNERWEVDWKHGWEHGEMRGGTNPAWIDGQYWTFFHSSVGDPATRRYFVGAYTFSGEPPFEPRAVTLAPLLVGTAKELSYDDRDRAHYKPKCVFPTSAFLHDGVWTVAIGINDTSSALVQLSHVELCKRVVECTSSKPS